MALRQLDFWRSEADDWHSVFSDEFLVLVAVAACAPSVGLGVGLLAKAESDRTPRRNGLRIVGWILVVPGILMIVALWLLLIGWFLSTTVR
jgi:hypothetical protein